MKKIAILTTIMFTTIIAFQQASATGLRVGSAQDNPTFTFNGVNDLMQTQKLLGSIHQSALSVQ